MKLYYCREPSVHKFGMLQTLHLWRWRNTPTLVTSWHDDVTFVNKWHLRLLWYSCCSCLMLLRSLFAAYGSTSKEEVASVGIYHITKDAKFAGCQIVNTVDEGLHGGNIPQSVVDWYCYVIAHNQFAYIGWRGPLSANSDCQSTYWCNFMRTL